MSYKVKGATRENFRDAIAHQRRCEKLVRDELPPARRYLLQTRPAQIANRKRLAAETRQIPDSELSTPPVPNTVRIVRPDVEAGVEKLKKAAGSGDVRRLAELNAGAKALNAGHRPQHVDFSQFANDDIEVPDVTPLPTVDWAKFPHDGEENDQ